VDIGTSGEADVTGRAPAAPASTDRARRWAGTMGGHESGVEGLRQAHAGRGAELSGSAILDRVAREETEDELLAPAGTRSRGAGDRPLAEEPDEWRTCFERDRDRILHSTAFRRLAGKTQVFVFPADHQRTRLTHALEVAQIARAIAAALGLNVALAEAIALGHDCGHGPFGHASEDAFDPLVPGGFDHAPWGADVTLAPLNLTRQVSDGIRNHSWSRPAPATPEGEACALADRIGYATHDAEDAARAGVVDLSDLPAVVLDRAGANRSQQLRTFITDVVETSERHRLIGMSEDMAEALAALRAWNYERIYLRPESVAQAAMVHTLLRALVEHYVSHPGQLHDESVERVESAVRGGGSLVSGGDALDDEHRLRAAVSYVAGMTDRFACAQASALLGWPSSEMPAGFDTAA